MTVSNADICKKIDINAVSDFLKKHDNYCILTHSSPDGDTLGSAFALAMGLAGMGKKAFVLCNDEIPRKYDYFVKKEFLQPFDYDTVLAVDVADDKLLGNLRENFDGKIDLCIDHHVSNTMYSKALYLDATAAANCEIIYEIILYMQLNMTDTMAAALYTGIATDTGCFKYSNVTAKTHIIAARLYEYRINADEICKKMFDSKSRNRLELERRVLDTAEFHFNEKCLLLTVTMEMLEQTGCSDDDLEGVAVISRSLEGVLAGVSIKQKNKDTYKVSLRTYEPLDALAICKKLGGGGHRAAAGCTMTGALSDVKKELLSVIGVALEESNAGTSSDK